MLPTAIFALIVMVADFTSASHCGHAGQGRMSNLWGDALESMDCAGPDGTPYPREAVEALVLGLQPKRRGRKLFPTKDPLDVRKELLDQYAALQFGMLHTDLLHRTARAVSSNNTTTAKPKVKTTASPAAKPTMKPSKIPMPTPKSTPKPASAPPASTQGNSAENQEGAACGGPPARLCRTRYNTTAPMYGVSLTSGKPVTIVQKFPDLLQQVIFEVCETSQCDILHGECVQTYTPHLFLVIPLGPVTLTGQDYVLVESGCVCRPKYTRQATALPLDSFSGR